MNTDLHYLIDLTLLRDVLAGLNAKNFLDQKISTNFKGFFNSIELEEYFECDDSISLTLRASDYRGRLLDYSFEEVEQKIAHLLVDYRQQIQHIGVAVQKSVKK